MRRIFATLGIAAWLGLAATVGLAVAPPGVLHCRTTDTTIVIENPWGPTDMTLAGHEHWMTEALCAAAIADAEAEVMPSGRVEVRIGVPITSSQVEVVFDRWQPE